MDDEPTCGKGLAANAVLPAKLAELLTALADTLEAHRPALDRDEPAGRQEDEACATLVEDQRQIAARLASLATRMEGCRTLPMASHDIAVMADPARMAPYARFVATERQRANMLQQSVAQGAAMLAETSPE
ncbi:MAG: hypothetical protein WED87_06315 [Dehalococcoidia bacterium]